MLQGLRGGYSGLMMRYQVDVGMLEAVVRAAERPISSIFFFNDTATTEIYTLSLHDALPISQDSRVTEAVNINHLRTLLLDSNEGLWIGTQNGVHYKEQNSDTFNPYLYKQNSTDKDRKSTRLNSSHVRISYAVFCLKKKIKNKACDLLGIARAHRDVAAFAGDRVRDRPPDAAGSSEHHRVSSLPSEIHFVLSLAHLP